MISLAVTILRQAGGLSSYDAVVTGLWAGGFTWFTWQVRRYRKERASPGSTEKSRQAVQAPPQMMKQPLPPSMKPMMRPQWPLKTLPGAAKSVKRLVNPAQVPTQPAQTAAPARQAPRTQSNAKRPAFADQVP